MKLNMTSVDSIVQPVSVVGACGIRSLYIPKPNGTIENKIEFYIDPSTEGEKKGAEFGKKYFGKIGEKIFGTMGYIFGPADKEKN